MNSRSLLINRIIPLSQSSIIQRDVTCISERYIGAAIVLISLQFTLVGLIYYGHVITSYDVNLLQKYFLTLLTLCNCLTLTYFLIKSGRRLCWRCY
jgi:hypothetical protein